MEKRHTILNEKICENIEILKNAHASNPIESLLLYNSTGFASYCFKKELIKEEFYDDNGIKSDIDFAIYVKTELYSISSDYELVIETKINREFRACNNNFTFTSIGTHHYNGGLTTTNDMALVHLLPLRFDSFSTSLYDTLDGEAISFRDNFMINWLNQFPWMLFYLENNIYTNLTINEIISKKLFSLRSYFKFKYKGFTFADAKMIHQRLHKDYFLLKFSTEFSGVLKNLTPIEACTYIQYKDFDKKTNWTPDFFELYGDIISHHNTFDTTLLDKESSNYKTFKLLASMAKDLGKKINTSWSLGKMKKMLNLWSFEYTAILYKYMNETLEYEGIFLEFEEHTGIRLLRDSKELAHEGFRLNHCISEYVKRVSPESLGIYTYKDFTLVLEINDYGKLYVSEFRGYFNIDPSEDLRMEVEYYLDSFNNR